MFADTSLVCYSFSPLLLFPPLLLSSIYLYRNVANLMTSHTILRELDRELEGSDHFPMSCASSVTIVSEHDQHMFASPVTSGGESRH